MRSTPASVDNLWNRINEAKDQQDDQFRVRRVSPSPCCLGCAIIISPYGRAEADRLSRKNGVDGLRQNMVPEAFQLSPETNQSIIEKLGQPL